MWDEVSSMIPMAKGAVLDKCDRIITEISAERDRRDNEYITNETNRRNKWRKYFFLKPLTRAQVANKLAANVSSLNWDYPSIYAWGTLDVALNLKRACREAVGEVVYISASDWRRIRD